jgi:mercuric ion binding protein
MNKVGLLALLLLAGSALAAEPRTVTLGVEHMTCAACPITVRKALSHVAGVAQSTVDMKAHTATVTFDPGRTTPAALATAVSQAGFPAKVLRNGG